MTDSRLEEVRSLVDKISALTTAAAELASGIPIADPTMGRVLSLLKMAEEQIGELSAIVDLCPAATSLSVA